MEVRRLRIHSSKRMTNEALIAYLRRIHIQTLRAYAMLSKRLASRFFATERAAYSDLLLPVHKESSSTGQIQSTEYKSMPLPQQHESYCQVFVTCTINLCCSCLGLSSSLPSFIPSFLCPPHCKVIHAHHPIFLAVQ